MYQSLVDYLRGIFLAELCLVCGKRVSDNFNWRQSAQRPLYMPYSKRNVPADLDYLRTHCCKSCRRDLAYRLVNKRVDRNGLTYWAIARYQTTVKRAILALKFAGQRDQAKLLGALLAHFLSRQSVLADQAYFVGLPLGPQRLRERGYNQVDLILTACKEYLPIKQLDLLYRNRETGRQSEQTGYLQRQANVANAFSICPEFATIKQLRERPIVLVDDVLTTGASLRSAHDCLVRAGFRQISCLVLAEVDP